MTMFYLIIAAFLWAPVTFADPAIIYGEDNRIDTFQSPSALFRQLAVSTAAMVHEDKIQVRGNGAELRGKTLGEFFKLCEHARFRHQPFIANCSGFLVAPDIVVSAGHCFESKDMCSKYRWVFDYKVEDEKQTNVTVPATSVYKCKEILDAKFTTKLDYAIIRLDRPVTDRSPVKIASKITPGTPVVMIGHPSGLPQKIADNAWVKSVSETEFKANVDAFQINSGSAVFNAVNGDLMGILVRGKIDYRTNPEFNCTEPNTTTIDNGGEDIAAYTQFEDSLIGFL